MENLPAELQEKETSVFMDIQKFEHVQRVGKMFALSSLVPDTFKGPNNIGNCVIALDFANRTGISPLMIMQKMYVIYGKPAIEAQLQIALFNKSGRFSTIRYNESGKDMGKVCYASAIEIASGEELKGPTVSMKLAKDEGWLDKKGSKWKTMPDLMLRYRSASFFIKTYCPEAVLGMVSAEEAADAGPKDITGQVARVELEEQLSEISGPEPDTEEEQTVSENPLSFDKIKNLKSADLKKYLLKHSDVWDQLSEDEQKSVRDKWARVYPDEIFLFDPEQKPEPEKKDIKTGIFGHDLADGFFIKCPDEEIKDKAQDVWDHPTKYRDNIGNDGSEQAYYKFLKFLHCNFSDGSYKRLVDVVDAEKPTKTPDLDETTEKDCPNTPGTVSASFCNEDCKHRDGCPSWS